MNAITIKRGTPSRLGDWSFQLEQEGMELASGTADSQRRIEAVALHYASQYVQDGDCMVTIRPPRGWRP